ncbi:MAG: radical SAM protein [Terracidiphilus sp.]
MRICLIYAPTSGEFIDPIEFNSPLIRRESCSPQLGMLGLAAITETLGCTTTIYDPNRAFFRFADAEGEVQILDFAEFAARQIGAIDADVYGFGSICSAYPLTLRIAKRVKEICPDSTILIGGPQASVVMEATLKAFPFVDFILRGEAENSLPLFLDELASKRRFENVFGLAYRSVWGVQRNPDAPIITDLDALPLPAYHLTGELRGERTAALELGRGCPFACTFCSTNDFFRRRFRLRSPQRIIDDMSVIDSEYGISDFDLVHDMFTVDAKRVRAFCQHMIESGKGYTWACSARTDSVDQELIELMAAAGCREIFFGVETGSVRMQKVIDKHLDPKRAHEIIDIVERAGIRSTISLITGFPEEQWDDLNETVQFFLHSARTPKSKPQINLLAPLASTPVHLKYKGDMTLEPLCSDVSHQGRYQHPEDIELIKRFPDIFSNFYLLPTPELDRNLLLELREFLRMATLRFRWLLGAADQATTSFLDLFVAWAGHRKAIFQTVIGSDLRHYYRTLEFQMDFIAFLRGHQVGKSRKVKIFMNFYEQLDAAESPSKIRAFNASETASGEPIDLGDIAMRTHESRVVELQGDLEAAIDAVRECRAYKARASEHFYVVSQVNTDQHPGYEVSSYIARVVALCDGRRTISEILECLGDVIAVTPQSARTQVYEVLIEEARSEGLVAIYRTASAAEASQVGGLALRSRARSARNNPG